MKKTRNLFLLTGTEKALSQTFRELHFKGLVCFPKTITLRDIVEVFNNNKSVLCVNIPPEYQLKVIRVSVSFDSASDDVDCIIINKGNIKEQFQAIADKHNCDIGDHVSNSSGLTGTPSIEDCAYCNFLYKHSYDINDPEIIIYQSKHFFVMPTLGQFIKGYLLIIPFEHTMSLAELDSSVREEFLTVLEDITTILKLTYNPTGILAWENGTGSSGRGKAKDSIVHAHFHVAPSTLTAVKVKELSCFPFKNVSISTLSDYGNHSYLLIKGFNELNWQIVSDPALYIPRQYIRQLIAHEYNISGDQWNWRKYPFSVFRHETAVDIYKTMLAKHDNLSDRLKKNIEIFMSNFGA